MRHGPQGGVGGVAGDVLAEERARGEGVPAVQRTVEEDEVAAVAQPAHGVVRLALHGRLRLLPKDHAPGHLLLLQVHCRDHPVGIQHVEHIAYGKGGRKRTTVVVVQLQGVHAARNVGHQREADAKI